MLSKTARPCLSCSAANFELSWSFKLIISKKRYRWDNVLSTQPLHCFACTNGKFAQMRQDFDTKIERNIRKIIILLHLTNRHSRPISRCILLHDQTETVLDRSKSARVLTNDTTTYLHYYDFSQQFFPYDYGFVNTSPHNCP